MMPRLEIIEIVEPEARARVCGGWLSDGQCNLWLDERSETFHLFAV